ncbi:FHA domain-containing protein [Planctomycetota bacterium]
MHLVVKQNGRTLKELQFINGPVHIGRHADSQVFLPDKMVSRHHAVIFSTQDGKWMVEDLDSANKTYLNDEAVHKSEIKTGDKLRINDFVIEIDLEAGTETEEAIHLEDTLTTSSHNFEDTMSPATAGLQIIVRKITARNAPDIKLPANRAKDFVQATEAICRADSLDEVLKTLLTIAAKQFNCYHVWSALRDQPTGPTSCHAGKRRDGSAVELSQIELNEKINQVVDSGKFLLMPRIPPQISPKQKIHSVIIAPIIGESGCFGVLYIDNDMAHTSYNMGDLDYMMLLAIHTAAIIKNF